VRDENLNQRLNRRRSSIKPANDESLIHRSGLAEEIHLGGEKVVGDFTRPAFFGLQISTTASDGTAHPRLLLRVCALQFGIGRWPTWFTGTSGQGFGARRLFEVTQHSNAAVLESSVERCALGTGNYLGGLAGTRAASGKCRTRKTHALANAGEENGRATAGSPLTRALSPLRGEGICSNVSRNVVSHHLPDVQISLATEEKE
jgi:hypothetical protein